jgi:hypothetical protein
MFALSRRIAAVSILAGVALFPASSGAQTAGGSTPAPAFSGSAAAVGVRVTVTIPGAPLTDVPFDGGGPTAQAAADSIGSSTGYAAFPDPGQFALTVPGLVIGILSSGLAGLPPIKLPSLPNYPFSVSSDASTAPDASAGSGPYQISANSETGSSKASATAGLNTGLSGSASLVTSTASLTPTAAGAVVAKAVSDVQGLSIGPLTLGEVKSTATETIDANGTITPSTSLEIAGLRIGGVAIEMTPQGFVAGGPTYPLNINSILDGLLKAAGIKVEMLAAQQFPGKVLAPAMQITFPFAMPFAIPNLGKFSGTVTMIIGSTTAQMSGAAAGAASGDTGATPAAGSAGSGTSTGFGAASGTPAVGSSGGSPSSPSVGSVPSPSPASVPLLAAPRPSAPKRLASSPVGRRAGLGAIRTLDIRSLYLVLVAGVVVAAASGQLIRRLGVRS